MGSSIARCAHARRAGGPSGRGGRARPPGLGDTVAGRTCPRADAIDRKEPAMPDETRHESADLEDYEVEDTTDTLTGDPGGDPLDRGVAPPQHWTAGMRFGTTADEQREGESL